MFWTRVLKKGQASAIAGIYGMNFEHMPELRWEYGYYSVMGVIAAICAALYVTFKRTKWL